MSSDSITGELKDNVFVVKCSGYLNMESGDSIAKLCYEQIDNGITKFLINLENTKMVNSIGVSILIEIIEKLQDIDGQLGFCNLAAIVEKTFKIMGLTQYSTLFGTESEGVDSL
ncbi:MAG: anti-anti-sigma factor [Candidatus Marinimicrobia bacterium]|nr:anti-anti-sigma factor [Candidatus Neomarinimicrobiota bacterium]|tara:strand:+ start:10794 stop:11135 length:342 start_codon:yes stop_codon:yes gene_type:complete